MQQTSRSDWQTPDALPKDIDDIQDFQAFWPYYLGEHQNAYCRGLHLIGTGLVLLLLSHALWVSTSSLILAVLCGYSWAWLGHAFFEGNRPATFRFPVWSLIADFKMFFLFLAGELEAERQRALPNRPTPPVSPVSPVSPGSS